MLSGRTIQELAAEVDRQNKTKKDYLASTELLTFSESGQITMPVNSHTEIFDLTENAHQQIASRINIPKPYYDRLRSNAPALLATNVNHWFKKDPEKRMLRTLDGKARAFLSEKYRALDNFDLMTAVLPPLLDQKVEIVSTEVTDHHMYIKVLFPDIKSEVKGSKQIGDIVQAGLVISNSEVGLGSLKVEPLLYRLICLNGAIRNSAMRKYHVGKGNGTSFEDIQELLADDTKRLIDQGFWASVRDIISNSMRQDIFEAEVVKLSEITQQQITGDVPKVIEVIRKDYSLSTDQGAAIMRNLISGGDLSRWGLVNATTSVANSVTDYETATMLERLGGKIIDLSPTEFRRIAEAA